MQEYLFLPLAEHYKDRIFAIAFNYCRNAADADDITQNVLLKLYQTEKKFEDEAHIKHWLIRVTINECKKLLVSPWFKKNTELKEYGASLDLTIPEESDLFWAVMHLPKKYRQVIHLYYYEDYSVQEIAAVLHQNPSTVQTQLLRGRERLKKKLEEIWSHEATETSIYKYF